MLLLLELLEEIEEVLAVVGVLEGGFFRVYLFFDYDFLRNFLGIFEVLVEHGEIEGLESESVLSDGEVLGVPLFLVRVLAGLIIVVSLNVFLLVDLFLVSPSSSALIFSARWNLLSGISDVVVVVISAISSMIISSSGLLVIVAILVLLNQLL